MICVWGRNERKENPGEWQSLYLWSSLLFFPPLITPSNPLFSCSTLRLSPRTPTKHFDSLSHLIHQSINLSITPSLPPFVCTQPYLPTTHALFLMHFVSPSCFFYAVQYRLFISVNSYSKVYTTSAPQLSLFWSVRPNVFSFNAYFVTTDKNSQNNTGGLGTHSTVCETMMPDELGTFYACFDLNSKSAFKCTPVHWPLFIESTADVRKKTKKSYCGLMRKAAGLVPGM